MANNTTIITKRFTLKELTIYDASARYLSWLTEPDTKKYIVTADSSNSIKDLEDYILSRARRDDVLFYGIFDTVSGLHIGNVKYDPVNSELGYAIMGIMIGDLNYRGKGVAPEVLKSSAEWLYKNRNINQILLGVDIENKVAISVYKKMGFTLTKTPYIKNRLGNVSMKLEMSESLSK